MANIKSDNLKLELTTDESTLFRDWYKIVGGKGPIKDTTGRVLVNKSNFELIDDAFGDVTENLKNYYTKVETDNKITELVKNLSQFDIVIVDTLDEVNKPGHLYLVPKENNNPELGYYEYVYLEQTDKVELVGSTDIVLDSQLSESSTNGVQNKAIKEALDTKADLSNTSQTIELGSLTATTKISTSELCVTGSATFDEDVVINTALTVTGTSWANGDLVTHEITPETNNKFDIGNNTKYYKKIYLSTGIKTYETTGELDAPVEEFLLELPKKNGVLATLDDIAAAENQPAKDYAVLKEQVSYLRTLVTQLAAQHSIVIPMAEIEGVTYSEVISGTLADGTTIPIEYID